MHYKHVIKVFTELDWWRLSAIKVLLELECITNILQHYSLLCIQTTYLFDGNYKSTIRIGMRHKHITTLQSVMYSNNLLV